MARKFRRSISFVSSAMVGLTGLHSARAVTPNVVGTVTLPAPDSNAFSTSFNFDGTGVLYAWNGLNVSMQTSSGTFTTIGKVPSGNNSDAGAINFSQDGTQVLVGNGAGGFAGGSYAGELFQLPKAGGNASGPSITIPYSFDFLPVPASTTIIGSASKYFVDEGNATFDGSSVSVFDAANHSNTVVIANIPGASASIAINPAQNRLYAEIGFGPGQGTIRSFDLSAVSAAANAGTSINFSAGTLFSSAATPQTGAGLFFDHDGYLFAGGDGGITVYNPDGSVAFEQDPTSSSYASIAYNPVLDEVLEGPDQFSAPSNTATLFSASSFESVPEPASVGLLVAGGVMALSRRRRT